MRISDWSSDVCSSDLLADDGADLGTAGQHEALSLVDRMVSRNAGGAGEKEQVFADEASSGRQREKQARALVRDERIVGGVAARRHGQTEQLEAARAAAGVRLTVCERRRGGGAARRRQGSH